jgi:hypothetical protein
MFLPDTASRVRTCRLARLPAFKLLNQCVVKFREKDMEAMTARLLIAATLLFALAGCAGMGAESGAVDPVSPPSSLGAVDG